MHTKFTVKVNTTNRRWAVTVDGEAGLTKRARVALFEPGFGGGLATNELEDGCVIFRLRKIMQSSSLACQNEFARKSNSGILVVTDY